MEPHHTRLDVDVIVNHVKLSHAHDVGRELGDVVLAREHDHATTLDPRHQVVAVTHRAADTLIQLRERRPGPRHVICGPAVELPRRSILLLIFSKVDEDVILPQMDLQPLSPGFLDLVPPGRGRWAWCRGRRPRRGQVPGRRW